MDNDRGFFQESERVSDSPPSLNLFLPNGLNISFRYQHTPDGMCVCVRQTFPNTGHTLSALETAHTELSRIITGQGQVIKTLRDGSTEVLFGDGTVSRCVQEVEPIKDTPTENKDKKGTLHSTPDTDTKQGAEQGAEDSAAPQETGHSWVTTTPSGLRVTSIRGKQAEPIKTFLSTDPFSHSVLISREDRVLSVLEKDGTSVVDHADGTRITTVYQQGEPLLQNRTGGTSELREKMVRVEKSGFPTLTLHCENKHSEVLLRDGTTIRTDTHGTHTVSLCSGGLLRVAEDGEAMYSSGLCATGPEGDQPCQYVMSLHGAVLCRFSDTDGTLLVITEEGHVSVTSPEGQGQELDQSCDPHPPRLFVCGSDGSAVEVLSAESVEEVLSEAYSDPTAAVIKEPLPHSPGVYGLTILKPFLGDVHTLWNASKMLDDIVPLQLRDRAWDTFPAPQRQMAASHGGTLLEPASKLKKTAEPGSVAAAPVVQCPDALLVRQITQHPPFSEQQWGRLEENLLGYIKKLLERKRLKKDMQLRHPRTTKEQHHTDLLNLLLSLPDSQHQSVSMETHPPLADVSSLYALAVSQRPDTGPKEDGETERTESSFRQKRDSLWGTRISQRRFDLLEQKRHLHCLRNNIITPYFHPEQIHTPHYTQQELDLSQFPRGRRSDVQRHSESSSD